ncbi:gamma-glutamylcyclotransferase family protein [Salisediminibacterium beveridgei]|uniref:Gamma-glutamylcyclotransferase family protein n=1 Tax=Salisediminibacterium beveridgei TaxID=632773 RepID=A0A1D7QXN0_9BACI|nr:gamma-glutamylcyclotransferase family protein [Salisediminibacterium beveridgei]AOM83762.1 AIG2 Family Protein [Salisediminibacterium beveridgei]
MSALYVFVYGTLLRGEANHGLLASASLVEERAVTNGFLVDTGNGYPALVESETEKTFGELYQIVESDLPNLDELEGYTSPGHLSNLYERKVQLVKGQSGRDYAAIVYVFEQDRGMIPIDGNDWRKR